MEDEAAIAEAIGALAPHYPGHPVREIATIVRESFALVRSTIGEQLPHKAVELARLRLDILAGET